MGTLVDEIERNAAIDGAKTNLELGVAKDIVIKFLIKQLDISEEEAKVIFEQEVLALVTA